MLKLPVFLVQAYVISYWAFALINLSSPLWWPLLHHPPPGGTGPVSLIVPLPAGSSSVSYWPETLVAAVAGASPCWLRRGCFGA